MKARMVLAAAMMALCALGAPALAAEDADKLEVVADEAKIVVGDKVVATVKKGDRLTRVRWVAVELTRDGKIIRGWIRAGQVAVAGKPKAPVVEPSSDRRIAHTVRSHDQRIKLLEILFAKPRVWSEHRFTVAKGNVKLTNKQIGRLKRVMTMRGTWPAKLNVLANVTPLDVRFYCDPDGRAPIKMITGTFGRADEETKGVICNIVKFNPRPVEAARGNAKIQGTWHRYGSIRLGVMADGRILALQIFGPEWRSEQKEWESGRK